MINISVRVNHKTLNRADRLIPDLALVEPAVGILGRGTRSDSLRLALEYGLAVLEEEVATARLEDKSKKGDRN